MKELEGSFRLGSRLCAFLIVATVGQVLGESIVFFIERLEWFRTSSAALQFCFIAMHFLR